MAPEEKCEYQRWSGADASFHMLRFAAERLREFPNVEFIELPDNDLSPIANSSIDFVYCPVIFMHLETSDRYTYVEEAFRVLRSGGNFVSITSIFAATVAGRFSKPIVASRSRSGLITSQFARHRRSCRSI